MPLDFLLHLFPFIFFFPVAATMCLLVPELETFTCTYSSGVLWSAFTATNETGNVTCIDKKNASGENVICFDV